MIEQVFDVDLKRFKTSLFALAMVSLAACGGGGGGSSSPPPTQSPPPSPPPPVGASFSLEGAAIKGLILGGVVTVTDPTDDSEILTGTTSTTDGSFDLTIPTSAGFTGGFVRVTVTGGSDARMICDAASGCGNNVAFGDAFPIDETVSLSAIVETPSEGNTKTVNVSALTDLAAQTAEAANGGLSATSLAEANSQVANLFGISTNDLSTLPAIDVTDPDVSGDTNALRAALINAGLLEAVLEDADPLGTALSDFLSSESLQNGEIVGNEDTDSPEIISLEDILEGALDAAQLNNSETDTVLGGIEASLTGELLTVRSMPAGQNVTASPSPTAGAEDLEKAKAFISDLQLIIAAVEREEDTANLEAFGDRIDDASALLSDNADEMQRALGQGIDLLAEAYSASIQTPSLTRYTASSGDIVTIQNDSSGIRLSISGATLNDANVTLEALVKEEVLSSEFNSENIGSLFAIARQIGEDGGIELSGSVSRDDLDLVFESGEFVIENLDVEPVDFGFDVDLTNDSNITASLDRFTLNLDGRFEDTSPGGVSLEGQLAFAIDSVSMSRDDEVFDTRYTLVTNMQGRDGIFTIFFDLDGVLTRAPISIGSTSIEFSGILSDGVYDIETSVALNGKNNQLAIEPDVNKEQYAVSEVRNNVWTLTYTGVFTPLIAGDTHTRQFITYSDAISEIDELGLYPFLDYVNENVNKGNDQAFVDSFIRSDDEPVYRSVYTTASGTTYYRYFQLSALDAINTRPMPTQDFLATPPYDNIVEFYYGLYNFTPSWWVYCPFFSPYDSSLFVTEPIDIANPNTELYGYLLLDNFDCSNYATESGTSLLYQSGGTLQIPEGESIDGTAYASIRQSLAGIDPDDPETELEVFGPFAMDSEDTVSGNITVRLSFAGRQFETGQRGFDAWENLTEPVTITNQDGVTLSIEEDEEGVLSGTLTIGDSVFATIGERDSGVIFVEFIDDFFVSLL